MQIADLNFNDHAGKLQLQSLIATHLGLSLSSTPNHTSEAVISCPPMSDVTVTSLPVTTREKHLEIY